MTFQKLVPAFVLLTALSVEAFLPTFDMMSEDQMTSFLPSPHPELVAAYRDFESRSRSSKLDDPFKIPENYARVVRLKFICQNTIEKMPVQTDTALLYQRSFGANSLIRKIRSKDTNKYQQMVLNPIDYKYGRPRITQIVNVTTPTPPCCADTISSIACRRLYNHNPARFLQRCEFDADFSLIQCCNTCGLESADQRYSNFFKEQQNSQQCYDRHSVDFCMRFLNKADVWGASSWNCDGAFATLAFRICRRTCGFCKSDLYSTVGGKFQVTPCGRSPRLIVAETIF